MLLIEHGEVVVVIAGGEDFFGGEAEGSGEFGEGGSFAVGLVAEAEVDGIALVAEGGNFGEELVEMGADPIHLLIVGRDDACGFLVGGDVAGTGFFFDVAADFFEEPAVSFEEFLVVFRLLRIPFPEGDPAVEAVADMELALAADEEIWPDGVAVLEDAVVGLI